MTHAARPLAAATVQQFLCDPNAYPERPEAVEVIETHISHVYLTDRFAYKLKKPVRFEFLDYSTVGLRRQACLDELRLNRRLAADVYLDALPITRETDGRFRLAGAGRIVDWVVQMRRLPADRTLESLIAHDRITPHEIDAIGQMLANFYGAQTPLSIESRSYHERVVRHVRANGADLARLLPDQAEVVDQLHRQQLCYLQLARSRFESRVQEGRILDGHGDLRPEHIYVNTHPVVIDCLEFSADLRQIDVADELAFLAMECDRLDAASIGQQLVEIYLRASQDDIPASLFTFYKAYRAAVRAKVTALRGGQLAAEAQAAVLQDARNYLQLAQAASARLMRPWILVVSGLMGTGKSTLARQLAESLQAPLLQTDRVRQEQGGAGQGTDHYGHGRYRPESRAAVYREMLMRAREALRQHEAVVLDGTFLSQALRRQVAEIADWGQAELLIVQCTCPREVALRRIAQRRQQEEALSEARPELYDHQQQEQEPIASDLPHLLVQTTEPLEKQQQDVQQQLAALLGLSEVRDTLQRSGS